MVLAQRLSIVLGFLLVGGLVSACTADRSGLDALRTDAGPTVDATIPATMDGAVDDDGGVADLFGLGEPCDEDRECLSGLCETQYGKGCVPTDVCGNGFVERGEACDDGNLMSRDGCDERCLRELGKPCTHDVECASAVCDLTEDAPRCEPSSRCGNGKVEGTEACDDGNLDGGDGCNHICLRETNQECTSHAQCASGLCGFLCT